MRSSERKFKQLWEGGSKVLDRNFGKEAQTGSLEGNSDRNYILL